MMLMEALKLARSLAPAQLTSTIRSCSELVALMQSALCIGNMDVPIVAVSAKRDEKKKTSNITMVIQVKSREQLDRVFTQLHKRSDIIEVYRGST